MGVGDVNVIVQYFRSVTTLGPFLTGIFFGVLLCWFFLRERLQLFALRLEDRDREIQALRTQVHVGTEQVAGLIRSNTDLHRDYKEFLNSQGSELAKMRDVLKRGGPSGQ